MTPGTPIGLLLVLTYAAAGPVTPLTPIQWAVATYRRMIATWGGA